MTRGTNATKGLATPASGGGVVVRKEDELVTTSSGTARRGDDGNLATAEAARGGVGYCDGGSERGDGGDELIGGEGVVIKTATEVLTVRVVGGGVEATDSGPSRINMGGDGGAKGDGRGRSGDNGGIGGGRGGRGSVNPGGGGGVRASHSVIRADNDVFDMFPTTKEWVPGPLSGTEAGESRGSEGGRFEEGEVVEG